MQLGKALRRKLLLSADLTRSLNHSMSRGNSLPQLAATEGVSQNVQCRDLRTPSPGGLAVHKALWRSRSVAKGKERSENTGKPENDQVTRVAGNFESGKMPVKRHKKGGLSMQLSKTIAKPHLVTRKQSQVLSQSFFSSAHSRQQSCQIPQSAFLEDELAQALANIAPEDFKAQSKVYAQFFTTAIAKSPEIQGLLARLKEGYEQLIENIQEKFVKEVAKLKTEIIGLQTSIIREADERKLLLRKIEKLSRENFDMGQQCETYDKRFTEFQDKLYDIANVEMEDFPPTENAWRLLNSELDHYRVWKKKWTRDLHITQSKEHKLAQLVHALKARGFPVEEVYNSEVRTPAVSVRSTVHREAEENESVRLVSGRPGMVQRPQAVPPLDLTEVEPDVTSDSSSEESLVSDATLRMNIGNVTGDSESPGKRSTGLAKASKALSNL